jgi:hypothetical protein
VDGLKDESHSTTNKTEMSLEITHDSEQEKVQSGVVLEEKGTQGRGQLYSRALAKSYTLY